MKYYRPGTGESLAAPGLPPIADQPIGQDIDMEDAREASPLPTVLKTAGRPSATVNEFPLEFRSQDARSAIVHWRPRSFADLAVISMWQGHTTIDSPV